MLEITLTRDIVQEKINNKVVVTLVHGTWASNAEWVRSDSLTAMILQKYIPNCVVKTFSWSGKNSHRSRLRASDNFKKHIEACNVAYPGCKQYVIAHSHGGNVVMYAQREQSIKEKVQGMVFLSTPFIYCRKRVIGVGGLVPIFIFMIFVYVLALYKTFQAISPGVPAQLQSVLMVAFTLVMLIPLIFITFKSWKAVLNWVHQDLGDAEDGIEAVAASFQFPSVDEEEILIIRTPGDEASSGLGAAYIMSAVTSYLSRWLSKVYLAGVWFLNFNQNVGLKSQFLYSSLAVTITSSIIFVVTFYSKLIPQQMSGLLVPSLVLCFLTLPFCLAYVISVIVKRPLGFGWLGLTIEAFAGALLVPCIALLHLFTTPFGLDSAVFAPFLELTAETSLPGTFRVLTVGGGECAGLWHSMSHEDEFVLNYIGRWILSHYNKRI